MRVCKHGCGVKLFGFSRANHASTNLKKVSSSKLDKFTLFTHSFVGWNMENRYKEGESIFLRLSWHFKREKSVFWKASFCKTRTDYACKTSWTRLCDCKNFSFNQCHTKSFAFFLGKLFYKSNRKLFPCVFIAWCIKTREGLGEFSTVMQTRDEVEGLHNCLEFSQPLSCFNISGYANTENVFYCLILICVLN